jgi:hypothetical protein
MWKFITGKFSHLISFMGNFIPKTHRNLFYCFLFYLLSCFCGVAPLQIGWIMGIVGSYLLFVIADSVYFLRSVKWTMDFYTGRFSLDPTVESTDEPSSNGQNNLLVERPRKETLLLCLGNGENADVEHIHEKFTSFSSRYGIYVSEAGRKRNRTPIVKGVKTMINKNSNFLCTVKTKYQNYDITKDNQRAVVLDMIEDLHRFCDVQCVIAFKNLMCTAVKNGYDVCSYSYFKDGIEILKHTEDSFLIMIYTLKICRTDKGIVRRVPVTTGKYCSFLLKVSTSKFFNFLKMRTTNTAPEEQKELNIS